jgi:hypothetical protein
MELNLQPLAPTCRASGHTFADGDRVVSYLVQTPLGGMARYDLLAAADAGFRPEGFVFCRWVSVFKPRPKEENRDRALKLTAENLFVTLADPANEPNPANTPLLQFLALMLERKRLLRPRGRTPDGERNLLEHTRTHQLYEIPMGDLNPEFFVKIQEQLGVLVSGVPAAKPAETTPPPA